MQTFVKILKLIGKYLLQALIIAFIVIFEVIGLTSYLILKGLYILLHLTVDIHYQTRKKYNKHIMCQLDELSNLLFDPKDKIIIKTLIHFKIKRLSFTVLKQCGTIFLLVNNILDDRNNYNVDGFKSGNNLYVLLYKIKLIGSIADAKIPDNIKVKVIDKIKESDKTDEYALMISDLVDIFSRYEADEKHWESIKEDEENFRLYIKEETVQTGDVVILGYISDSLFNKHQVIPNTNGAPNANPDKKEDNNDLRSAMEQGIKD